MSQQPLHIAVLIGSVRTERFGHTVAAWFAELAWPAAPTSPST